MLSLQEIALKSQNRANELSRKDALRRSCVKEFTSRLNAERARDNKAKITKWMWEKRVGRNEAIKALKAHKDKKEKIWPPYTERAIHFKTVHLDSADLRDFLDMCNKAEKDKKSFGMCFSVGLKIK